MEAERDDGQAVMRSFRGQTLANADFSGRDLRGADFTGADLRSANFREASVGVAPRVGAATLGLGILVAVAAGVAIGWSVSRVRQRITGAEDWDQVAEGSGLVLTLLILLAVILWKGFDVAIRVTVVFYLFFAAITVVANLIWEEFELPVLLRATALIVFVVLAILAGILGRVVGGVFGGWSVAIVAVLGGLATGQAQGGMAGVIVAVSLAIISKRALRGDQRDATLRRVSHRLIRRWGTRFVNADLTGADFTGTDASQCDSRGAIVTDVIWDDASPRPLDLPTDDERTT